MNEFPERIKEGDPRIGRRVRVNDGFEGVIVAIFKFQDDYELFSVEKGSMTKGGVEKQDITFLD